MYVVQHVYISDDVIDKHFVCDLAKCKGACCVEGDFGAPLEDDEKLLLERLLPEIKPFLSPEGLQAIEKQGAFIRDAEGDFSTPTINDRECAYALYDSHGILKCGIEQAYRAGKIDFPKPISCHLYPIRVTKLMKEEALNYHQWDVCDAACALGKTLQLPIYKFLKEALIRRYGEAWYAELEAQVQERMAQENNS
jgi:hypothetical protein